MHLVCWVRITTRRGSKAVSKLCAVYKQDNETSYRSPNIAWSLKTRLRIVTDCIMWYLNDYWILKYVTCIFRPNIICASVSNIPKPKKCGMSCAELAGEHILNTCSHDPNEFVIAGLGVRDAQRKKREGMDEMLSPMCLWDARPTRLS